MLEWCFAFNLELGDGFIYTYKIDNFRKISYLVYDYFIIMPSF
jgi:hypothetical protein